MSRIVLDEVKDFNLEHIFDCGQCFRWNAEDDGSYTGVAGGRAVNVALSGKSLVIDNTTADDFEEFWRDYFDMDTDYGKIKDALRAQDPVIGKAIDEGEGIRLLDQEIWETIVSFIISANNNIPRIKGCIESLCENFGEKIGRYRGKTRYAFPTAQKLASLTTDDLVPCRLGYRAKYIINTAKMYTKLDDKYFEELKGEDVSYEDAFKKISQLQGVGPKVANCILLFSLKKRDAFPIDVWMKKVMNHLYGFEEEDVKGMEKFASETFGDVAGIAQQYLFYYMRNKALD